MCSSIIDTERDCYLQADTHSCLQKLHATFLVSGWTKDSNPHHVVRLVEGRALEDAKSQLSVVTAMHVYSVQPAVTSSKDTLSLYNTDLSQSEELLRKMLGPAATTDLLGSKLSTVLCESAQRSTGAVQQGPEVVPEAVAQSAITKVAPAPVKPAAASPVKEAVKPPASKPAKKSVATARKQAAKAVTAKNVPPSGTEVKDVALKKEEGNGKRVIIDDSDSEDDVAPAAEAAPPPMKKVKQSAAATLDTDSKGRSKEKAAAAPEKGSQQASLLAKQSGTTKSRGAGAGGAKRKRRVEKTYFNDAGEEVTGMHEAFVYYKFAVLSCT